MRGELKQSSKSAVARITVTIVLSLSEHTAYNLILYASVYRR